MKLLLVSASLTNQLRVSVKEIEGVTETKKTYRYGTKVINKEKMVMVANTIFVNNISNREPFISYKTYCLEKDKMDAKIMLVGAIKNRLAELRHGFERLQKGLNRSVK